MSQFCDDIRFEQQSKFSLIGCYGPELLFFSPPPLILPKLGVLIQIRTPAERAPAIKIMLYNPGETEPFYVHEQKEEEKDFVPKPIATENEQDLVRYRGMLLPLIFSPFVIERPGLLKVRMLYGSETIRLGTLELKHQPSVEAPAATA